VRGLLGKTDGNWTTPSVRRLIRRLGIAVTLITILLPPLGYATLDLRELQKRASEHASVAARQVEAQLTWNREGNWLNEVSTNVLRAMRHADGAVAASWLTDKSGTALMFSGQSPTWPEVRRSAAVKGEAFEGFLHVAVSTREVWLETSFVALVFLLLGLAAHVCITRWPLAALESASRLLEESREELQRQKAELEMQNLRLDAAVNNMPIGLVMFDSGKRLIVGNERYRAMYGLPPEVMRRGTHLREMLEYRLKAGSEEGADREAYIQRILKLVEKKETEVRVVTLGDGRTISIIHHPIAAGGWIGTHEDVTEREKLNAQLKRQHELLKSKQQQLDAALNSMAQGLAMFDADLRVVIANDRYAEIYGLPPERVAPGTSLQQIIESRIANGDIAGKTAEEVVKSLLAPVAGHKPAHYVNTLRNGRIISVSIEPMPDGGYVSTHRDVTEERRAEARIAHMAMHDALTDLPNRALLHKRLERAISGVRQGDGGLAALMLDLDRFKEVNDTLGHAIGDSLLKSVTGRLRGCTRATDTIGRLGGDEFAVLARVTEGASEAAALAKNIVAAMAEPFDLDGHRIAVGASIGIALAPQDSADPEDLLKKADLALYRTKSDGRGTYRFFAPEMDQRMHARRELERDLRAALVNGQFELHYQPLVNLERDEVCGFEALLRWNHPERGKIAPLAFIPLAEETGLIVPIGEWVLRQACADAARWPDHLKVAVNVSPLQFRSGNFPELVAGVLARTGVAPGRLEVEITESVVLEDSDAAFGTLQRLHELGVRIALDDFGIGYSSLSNLRRFPFDKIKIDRSFVADLSHADVDAVAIVRSVAQLGVTLGMATAAEGVESAEQLEQVRAEGCTEIQGYYICEPSPAHVIERIFLPQFRGRSSASAA
jgi:diguanylate cyclase (GGDEF)-like protein